MEQASIHFTMGEGSIHLLWKWPNRCLFIPPGRPGGYCGLGRALLQCAETTVGEETRETAEERAAVAMKRVARSDSRRIKNFRNQIFSQPKLAYVRRNSKKPANQKNLGPNLTPKFLAKISP